MTYAELARKLQRLGCELRRHSKGSHEIWSNPTAKRSASIPRHSGDLPTGTLKAILRQLEISREDLDQA